MREERTKLAGIQAELAVLPPLERRPLAFSGRFGRVAAPAKLDELLAVATGWGPELVVFESTDLAAPIVAAALGVRRAQHAFGRAVPLVCFERAAEVTEPLWRSVGLEPDPLGGVYGGPFLDLCPPSFQSASVPPAVQVEPIRPAFPPDPGEREPASLAGVDPARPLVYLTLGTEFNDAARFPALFDALADVDCTVFATVGSRTDPAALGPLPANAVVERYVPQAFVLARAAAAVGHGGSGSTLAALAHGVPLLALPQGADQFENGATVAALGAGRVLMPGEQTPEAVRDAVVALLADAVYRDGAGALASEIAAMPPAADVAARLAAGPSPVPGRSPAQPPRCGRRDR